MYLVKKQWQYQTILVCFDQEKPQKVIWIFKRAKQMFSAQQMGFLLRVFHKICV